MSLAAVSKHVKLLERAGIVQREIRGRTHICRLNAEALNEAYSWLGGYEDSGIRGSMRLSIFSKIPNDRGSALNDEKRLNSHGAENPGADPCSLYRPGPSPG